MSLINEALKRTRDASYQPVTAPPPVAPGYQIQNAVDSRGLKHGLIVTVVVALIAIVGVVMVGLRVANNIKKLKDGFASDVNVTTAPTSRPESATRAVSPPATPAKAETPAPEQAPVIPVTTQTPPTPAANPKSAEDELVGRLMVKIKAEQAATTPKPLPEPPKLVLQGITLAADGSEAMINGISLRAGEDIEGARITTIERRAVRLDFGGREIVLRLP